MDNIAEKLAAEFPKEAISWRAQSVTADGKKALALAYIDARDVMKRLDEVCGVERWQCRYPIASNKTICEIGIFIQPVEDGFGEWVWKADGAGDSDIEAEKGAISDAFKRAAVKWGIGRYLYGMDAVWVPCESYKSGDKYKWKSFTADPWKYVEGKTARSVFTNASLRTTWCNNVYSALEAAESESALDALIALYQAKIDEMKAQSNEHDLLAVDEIRTRYQMAKMRIRDNENLAASYGQGFAATK